MYRKTFVEIDAGQLAKNVQSIRSNFSGYEHYFGVLKGNAYGHGFGMVQRLVDAGITYVAVSSLEEAVSVRREGVTIPILCLQPIHLDEIQDAVRNQVTITVSNYEYFKQLAALPFNGELKVHLKLNTGFNRLGIASRDELFKIVESLKDHLQLKLEGLYTHFATSGVFDSKWDSQLAAWKEITSRIDVSEIPIVHLGRSITLLTREKIPFANGVRVGYLMYGYGQVPKAGRGVRGFFRNLKRSFMRISPTVTPAENSVAPAFSLKSEVIEVRSVASGETVGYGAAFRVKDNSRVAVVSVGYTDGYSRRNAGGQVAIRGKRFRIVAVDMCLMTVLVDESVNAGDIVELVGPHMPARSVAHQSGTTTYDVLASIQETLPRTYL